MSHNNSPRSPCSAKKKTMSYLYAKKPRFSNVYLMDTRLELSQQNTTFQLVKCRILKSESLKLRSMMQNES